VAVLVAAAGLRGKGAAGPPTSASTDRSAVLQGRAGAQRRWALRLETAIAQDSAASGAAAPAPPRTISVSGEWVATVSGENAAGYDVAYELQGVHAAGSRV